jgi:starch-binding outer membrane protein, SusD/RagB family
MKRLQIIITSLFLVLITLSCKDFLKETMVSDVSSSSYYVTDDGLHKALSASYFYLKDSYYAQTAGMYLTLYGTDTYAMGATGDYTDIDQYLFDSSNKYITTIWISLYKAVNQCNAVIGRAKESTEIEESIKNEYVAEARFLRALYYFILVRQFGDVHLTLEETIGVQTEANKTSRTEIYEKAIIPDLEYAREYLPVDQTDNGRATKGAANFLLSKVYLHRGWLTGSADDFQKSITLAEAVINSGEYFLLSDYASLWNIENQTNNEVIWSVQNTTDPITNGNGNWAHLFFLGQYDSQPGMQRAIEYGRPYRRFNPTVYTLSQWNRQYDSRYYKSFQHVWYANYSKTLLSKQQIGDTAIFFPGVNVGEKYYISNGDGKRVEKTLTQAYINTRHNISSRIFTPSQRDGKANTGYDVGSMFPTLLKFLDPKRLDKNTTNGTRDWVVMRLAEAYLIAAEAYFKTGNNNKAAEMLNVVRNRAAWPGFENQMKITASDITLDFILDERARELLGEDERWYDLTRTGTLIDRIKKYHIPTNGINYAISHIEEKHLLRPIPQDQIDKCSNDYPQNPGY